MGKLRGYAEGINRAAVDSSDISIHTSSLFDNALLSKISGIFTDSLLFQRPLLCINPLLIP